MAVVGWRFTSPSDRDDKKKKNLSRHISSEGFGRNTPIAEDRVVNYEHAVVWAAWD